LVAVGYDGDRKEVTRTSQWINLPRQPAETSVVLNNAREGRGVTASLVWNSVISEQPQSISVSFDGTPLEVTDPASIPIPDHDPAQLHFIRAEVNFSDTVSSRTESTFGGAYADNVSTELTAVPVLLKAATEVLVAEGLRGVSQKNSQLLPVVAIEDGPAEILIILDEGSRESLRRLGRISTQDLETFLEQEEARRNQDKTLRVNPRNPDKSFRVGTTRQIASSSLRSRMTFEPDTRVQFLSPFSEHQERSQGDMDIFPPSGVFTVEDGGLYWLLMQSQFAAEISGPQRLADAVAAGSVLVTRRNRRRAVVLILGEEPQDASVFDPPQVESFLAILRVPLFIWSTGDGGDSFSKNWKSVTRVASLRELESAAKTLFDHLDRQRIVWLDGIHLPQDVVISSPSAHSPVAQ
jgi:hypothetical protein